MTGGKNREVDMVMDVTMEANSRLKNLLDKQLDTSMERIELVEFVRGESVLQSGGPAGIASLSEFKAYEAQEQDAAVGRRDTGGETSTAGVSGGSRGQERRTRKKRMAAAEVTFRGSKSAKGLEPKEEGDQKKNASIGGGGKLGRHAAELEASLLRETVSVHGISHLTKTGGTLPGRQTPAHQVLDILEGITPEDRVRQLAEAEASHKRTAGEVFSQRPRPLLDIESHVKERLKVAELAAELAAAENDADWADLVLVSEEEIAASRLSLAEIRALPGGKFADYSAGTPSRTLYVKNLAKAVEAADLRRLFGRFRVRGSGVSLRLMKKGRMKGQAFVTFTDTDMARRALELINGFVLKGKPMVIQYGREGSSTS